MSNKAQKDTGNPSKSAAQFAVVLISNGSTEETARSLTAIEQSDKVSDVFVVGARPDSEAGNDRTQWFAGIDNNLIEALGKSNCETSVVCHVNFAESGINLKSWLSNAVKVFKGANSMVVASKALSNRKERISNQINFLLSGADKWEGDSPVQVLSTEQLSYLLFHAGTTLNEGPRQFLGLARRLGVQAKELSTKYESSLGNNVLSAFVGGVKGSIRWLITIPLKESAGAGKLPPVVAEILKPKEHAVFRLLYTVLVFGLMMAMPLLSFDYGISADEDAHHRQAVRVMEYFQDGNEGALNDPKNFVHLYGQSFDFYALLFAEAIGMDHLYEVRHFLNAITGWLAILFAGLCAILLGGYRSGLLTVLLMAITPRFFGHSMNNPMDIPFAAAYIMGVYYIIRNFTSYPKIRWRYVLLGAIGIGGAISIRIGGLLLFPYVVMFAGLVYLRKEGIGAILNFKKYKEHGALITSGIAMLAIGYVVGLHVWPYAIENPVGGMFEALEQLTNIKNSLTQLFEGQMISSEQLPWYYIPKYMMITLPIVVLLGIGLYGLLSLVNRKKFNHIHFFVVFSAIFPIAYVIYKHSNVYGGWRHLLFTFPSWAILSAVGWNYLVTISKNKFVRLGVGAIIVVLAIEPTSWMIKNHPHQYVYFNKVSGGVEKAYGVYEMDYYFRCQKEAAEWLIEKEGLETRKDTIVVASNHGSSVRYFFRHCPTVKVKYVSYYDKSKKDWDYGIFVNTFINVHQLEHNYYPPPGTMHAINVDEKPIVAIVKRPTKADMEGFSALFAGQYQVAIQKFNDFIKVAAPTEEILHGMATSYLSVGDNQNATARAAEALQLHPEYLPALEILAQAQMGNNDYQGAISTLQQLIRVRPAYFKGHFLLGAAYYSTGNFDMAIASANQAIQLNPGFAQAYQLVGSAYQQKGDNQSAQQYFQQAQQLSKR